MKMVNYYGMSIRMSKLSRLCGVKLATLLKRWERGLRDEKLWSPERSQHSQSEISSKELRVIAQQEAKLRTERQRKAAAKVEKAAREATKRARLQAELRELRA